MVAVDSMQQLDLLVGTLSNWSVVLAPLLVAYTGLHTNYFERPAHA